MGPAGREQELADQLGTARDLGHPARYNATNTALMPLGTINLKRPDYIPQTMTFGATGTPSTLTMNGNSLTVTLGTPSRVTGVAALATNSTWTPDAGATDPAGNSASTTAWTENDNDLDF